MIIFFKPSGTPFKVTPFCDNPAFTAPLAIPDASIFLNPSCDKRAAATDPNKFAFTPLCPTSRPPPTLKFQPQMQI